MVLAQLDVKSVCWSLVSSDLEIPCTRRVPDFGECAVFDVSRV